GGEHVGQRVDAPRVLLRPALVLPADPRPLGVGLAHVEALHVVAAEHHHGGVVGLGVDEAARLGDPVEEVGAGEARAGLAAARHVVAALLAQGAGEVEPEATRDHAVADDEHPGAPAGAVAVGAGSPWPHQRGGAREPSQPADPAAPRQRPFVRASFVSLAIHAHPPLVTHGCPNMARLPRPAKYFYSVGGPSGLARIFIVSAALRGWRLRRQRPPTVRLSVRGWARRGRGLLAPLE